MSSAFICFFIALCFLNVSYNEPTEIFLIYFDISTLSLKVNIDYVWIYVIFVNYNNLRSDWHKSFIRLPLTTSKNASLRLRFFFIIFSDIFLWCSNILTENWNIADIYNINLLIFHYEEIWYFTSFVLNILDVFTDSLKMWASKI